MQSLMREYTWQDVLNFLYDDMGMSTDEDRRQRGEVRYLGSFQEPEHTNDTCICIVAHEARWDERIREHVEGGG